MKPRVPAGQSSLEYLVILAGVAGVFLAVPEGSLEQLLDALARAYLQFTEGVSRP